MTNSDREFPEVEVSFHDYEEVNAQACHQIEEEALPYVMVTKSTPMGSDADWSMGLVMGNGIHDLATVREMLVRCLDQVDLIILRES